MKIARAQLRAANRIAQTLLLVGFGMSAAAVADGSSAPATVLTSGPSFPNDLESSLVRAIVGLRNAGAKQAMVEIDKILERHPNFKLGYLVKGDMLMAQAGKPVAFASASATAADVAPLQDEARARLARYLDAPRVDDLPAPVLQMAPNQQHVLLVDTSRNRLFVYANDHGKPRYVTDFYVSIGKLGAEKQRSGDQKTPIGVYRVVSAKDRLPDFYGPGAFPLDYPNEWDRLNRRDGSGIWLHGTPSETYSRPPLATDGCVVLPNEDFKKLSSYIEVAKTPVVIAPGVQFEDPKDWDRARGDFLAALDKWKADWESRDLDRYFSNYAPDFRSGSHDFASWKANKRRTTTAKSWIKVGVNNLSLFAYPGQRDLVVATFEQDYRSNNLSKRTVKRQYWTREGKSWRIVHEAVL